jgi:AcrR family transcriptional regulator
MKRKATTYTHASAARSGTVTRSKPSTRERILDGAIRAVARHGLSKLGMGDVSASAGVSRGTLYRYFPSREDLLDGVAAREVERFMEAVLAAVHAVPTGEERLRVVLEIATKQLREHAALQRLIESDPGFVLESLRERFPAVRSQIRDMLAPVLKETRSARARTLTDDQLVEWLTRFLISMYLFPPTDPGDLADGVTAAYRLLSAGGHSGAGKASGSSSTGRKSKKDDRSSRTAKPSKSGDTRRTKTTAASRRARKPRK